MPEPGMGASKANAAHGASRGGFGDGGWDNNSSSSSDNTTVENIAMSHTTPESLGDVPSCARTEIAEPQILTAPSPNTLSF